MSVNNTKTLSQLELHPSGGCKRNRQDANRKMNNNPVTMFILGRIVGSRKVGSVEVAQSAFPARKDTFQSLLAFCLFRSLCPKFFEHCH